MVVRSPQALRQDGDARNTRGLHYLSPAEQAPLVTMPSCLVKEIGLCFSADLDYGERVIRLFWALHHADFSG